MVCTYLKKRNSKDIGHFHHISLLNVGGKIFSTVLASRLTRYLLINGYINTLVQKGGVPGIASCLEHGNMIGEAIQKAKTNKKDLDIIWLDSANAYGSVPHQMILLFLQMFHIPEEISKNTLMVSSWGSSQKNIQLIRTALKLELRWDVQCHQYFLF